ncbi:MAG TPA: cation transporter [Polyangia bacterium]|nr:cation transporter [Polyangia bacterium]
MMSAPLREARLAGHSGRRPGRARLAVAAGLVALLASASASAGQVRVVHSISGRVRVHSSSVYGSPDEANRIQRSLERLNGVESVETNALTGSVLVRYRPQEVTETRIVRALRGSRAPSKSAAPPQDQPTQPDGLPTKVAHAAVRAVARETAERMAMKTGAKALERIIGEEAAEAIIPGVGVALTALDLVSSVRSTSQAKADPVPPWLNLGVKLLATALVAAF